MLLKKDIETERLKPLVINGLIPLCSVQYEKLFGTTRLPGQEAGGFGLVCWWEVVGCPVNSEPYYPTVQPNCLQVVGGSWLGVEVVLTWPTFCAIIWSMTVSLPSSKPWQSMLGIIHNSVM